jgi:YD repeat-containing protein
VVLCKQVEQATLDANGSQGLAAVPNSATISKKLTYTYNQYGQVLTSTDASGNVTTYAYYQATSFAGTVPNEVGHYQGDLQTVTNTKGHFTQYTLYDKAGRVLSMTDPNAVTTSFSYWPRGWLKASKQCVTSTCDTTTAAGGLLTTYDYWPTGLLKKVTQPDGSALNYAYDDAHRLTDVSDNLGNKVHYTLDNAGNRLGEDVSDPTSTLTRQISRAYDDLNRLKSVTGAMQ